MGRQFSFLAHGILCSDAGRTDYGYALTGSILGRDILMWSNEGRKGYLEFFLNLWVCCILSESLNRSYFEENGLLGCDVKISER